MRCAFKIVMLALATSTGAQTPAPAADASALGWLEGCWTGTQASISAEECWTSAEGGVLLGLHKDIKDGRLVSWEFLRIAAAPEGLTYFASPRSAAPTPFRLAELASQRVVFANPQHDFPQRILYWLDAQGALHARVEGPSGGQERAQEWVWTKRR